MTDELKKKILEAYNTGANSIVNIARLNNVSVEEVLEITGNTDVMEVTFMGDQIDQAEAGQAPVNKSGVTYKQGFTKN